MADDVVKVQPNPGSSTNINVDVSDLTRTDGTVVARERINIGDPSDATITGLAVVSSDVHDGDVGVSVRDPQIIETNKLLQQMLYAIETLTLQVIRLNCPPEMEAGWIQRDMFTTGEAQ